MDTKIKKEIERILEKMQTIEGKDKFDSEKLRDHALTIESLVMSLIRLHQAKVC